MAINLCGQMDLFSMLGDIGGKPYNNMTISADIPSAFSGKTENENSDNLDDYLSVEEKILTLLKKKKEMKLTTNSEIYSIFSKKKIEEEDMEYVSDKLEDYLRELLLDCVPGNVQEEDFRLSDTLEDLMWYSPAADYIRHFDFINRGNMACSQFQIIGTRGVKPYYQLIGYESYKDLPVYLSINKMKKRQRGKCYYRTGNKKNTMAYISDAAFCITRAVMFNEVVKVMDEDSTFKDYVKSLLSKEVDKLLDDGLVAADDNLLERICHALGTQILTVKTAAPSSSTNLSGKRYTGGLSDILQTKVAYSDMALYCHLLGIRVSISYFHMKTWYDKALVKLYCRILKRNVQIEKMVQYNRKRESDYAKSFQTKKGIPDKVLKAMKESQFNDYFGYIEMDEECDIDKVAELAKEWSALSETYFGGKRYEDVSLRFRKLGNHHAIGLYYTWFRCICVDVRNPKSMVHEFMHMIDDGTLTGIRQDYLSIKDDFSKILNRYCYFIDKSGENLSGKYNKSYYKTPTEVFARCGEIYVHRMLGVNDSLVGDCQGFAYPDDEYLNRYIREYYDNLFAVAFGKEGDCDE